jgi:hypothetical protein
MTAPDIFRVADAYDNPEQAIIDKALIQQDAWGCYDAAIRGDYQEAQKILLDWALHCREVQGKESRLVMSFKGQLFLESWLIMKDMDWNKMVFPPWVYTVFRPCAESIYWEGNNQGAWGILGCVLSDMVLNKGKVSIRRYDRISEWLDDAIAPDGTMKIEILRTNSGMWYSYFALAPILRACQLTRHPRIDDLRKPLAWLFNYCLNPDSWPYKPRQYFWWLFPRLQRKIHPYEDKVDIPRDNDWAGSLYSEAGRYFNVPEWSAWAKPWPNDPPYPGVNIFRWS